jgi:hypothetical protein
MGKLSILMFLSIAHTELLNHRFHGQEKNGIQFFFVAYVFI